MQLFLVLCQTLRHSEQQRLRLEEENRHHRQERHWWRRLLANRELSSSHKIALMGVEPELSASGLKQVNLARVSDHIGLSAKTTGRCIKQLAEAGALERQEERELKDDGSVRTHVLLAPTEVTARPQLITLPQPRNHGGRRTRCHHCGSEDVVEQVTVTCQGCGAVLGRRCRPLNPPVDILTTGEEGGTCEQPMSSPTDETVPFEPIGEDCHKETRTTPPRDNLSTGGEGPDEALPSPKDKLSLVLEPEEPADKLSTGVAEPATAPNAPEVIPSVEVDQGGEEPATPPAAAPVPVDHDALVALLMDIAGDASQHVVMNDGSDPTFDGKYRTVHRPLRESDIRAHLAGRRTIGATLSHTDGTTRALCFDTDTPEGLALLHEAAGLLRAAGLHPLIEVSPSGRGGHLWVIFDGPVQPDAAYHLLCEIAPQLRDLKEHWPITNRKVRLLAGLYVTPTFQAACPLLGPHGRIPAKALLTLQTPASSVSTHSFRSSPITNERMVVNERTNERNGWHERRSSDEPPGQVSEGPDAYWQRKYGGHQPFGWTHRQLVQLFNQHVSVSELLPPERGGKALATWDGGEHTPSVAFTPDGKGWVDFRARSIRSDGTPDGGDALELVVRLSGRSKSEVMADFSRYLRREWLAVLDGAAARGEPVPERLVPYMTPEGWQRYERLRRGAGSWFDGGAVIRGAQVSLSRVRCRPSDEEVRETPPLAALPSRGVVHHEPPLPTGPLEAIGAGTLG